MKTDSIQDSLDELKAQLNVLIASKPEEARIMGKIVEQISNLQGQYSLLDKRLATEIETLNCEIEKAKDRKATYLGQIGLVIMSALVGYWVKGGAK